MNFLTKRRWSGLLLLLAAVVGAFIVWRQFAPLMPRFTYSSGWLLFAIMLLLTFYNGKIGRAHV